MAVIIAVENTKGGAGKSTTVSNLARGLQLEGNRVLIIDRDPLRIIRKWREASTSEDYPLVVGIDTPTVHRDIQKITDNFDYIIIDGAAGIEEMAASSIRAADLVLIPLSPSGAEAWGSEPLIRLIKARQEVTDGLPIARFLINKEKKRTVLSRNIQGLLAKLEVPVLNSRLTDNVLYTECLFNGSSVFDVEGSSAHKLKQQMKQLIDEIKELCNEKIRCV